MKRCSRCMMPDTRPSSVFDADGVCLACRNYDARDSVNWDARLRELRETCERHSRQDGYYDCLIPVSGGKDSFFLTYMLKEELGMNPLLTTVGDPFTKTAAGLNNLRKLSESFGCDHIGFNLSVDCLRRVTKIGFEELGEPLRFVEAAIYTFPTKLSIALGIPLIVYGENSAYEYGTSRFELRSAMPYILEVFDRIDLPFWLKRGISQREVNALIRPSKEELARVSPDPVFMSHFVPWSGDRNLEIAKRYGFRDLAHEWQREGNIEDFDQIDSVAYIVHLWLKYPKFGFGRATDIASRWIRTGRISREQAETLVAEHDHKLDQRALQDFIAFLGYSERQFWTVVETLWNRDLFERRDGIWRLRSQAKGSPPEDV